MAIAKLDSMNEAAGSRVRHLEPLQGALDGSVRSAREHWDALDHHAVVTITDRDGAITHVTQAFCEMSGYSREELLGQTHRLVNSGVHPQTFFEQMWRTITGGQVWKGELCNRTKDGRLIWLAATIVPILGDDGTPREYIAFRTELTAQKRAEEALRQAKEAAEAASLAKGRFLASMSHEIRTPMNAILGMTALALELTPPASELQEHLEVVRDSAQALLATLNDVLDFSKIEAGRLTLEERPFEPAQELDRALKPFTALAVDRGLSLTWALDASLEGYALGDAHRLRQIVNNLVGNALKFTERGGITVAARREGEQVLIEVHDTGIGIASDSLDRVFEAFEQAETGTTRRFGGTGLGLSITRNLAALMGGTITLFSQPSVGTTASVRLRVPTCAPPAPEVTAPIPTPDRPLHVLVAEDNLVNQRLAVRLLERWGHRVTLVGDGREAVRQAMRGGFDLILMDLDMPRLGGLEATQLIREFEGTAQHTPIVAMTASAMLGDRERCLRGGMDDYLSKPLDLAALRRGLGVWTRP